MKNTISLIIPAKNEAKSLASLLPDIIKHCHHFKEIIIVDDGSDDNTRQLCAQHEVTCISHPYSLGNGAAIKSGARHAKGEVLVMMDADGQHQPEQIASLVETYSNGFDLIVGARSAKCHASFGRKWANRIYNKLASYMTGQKVKDLTSGFRVVNADKFREFLYLYPNGFSYPTTSTMAFFRSGYAVGYVDISANVREGKSHLSWLRDGIRFLLIIFKIGSLYSPLKLFFPLAMAQFAIGLGYYIFTYFSSGRFTNMSALMFTSALTIFLIGLVSEQITTLFYRKPN